jgi:hypothetical protein
VDLRSFSSAEAGTPFLKKQHDHFSNISALRPPCEKRELLRTVNTIYQLLKQQHGRWKSVNLGRKKKARNMPDVQQNACMYEENQF